MYYCRGVCNWKPLSWMSIVEVVFSLKRVGDPCSIYKRGSEMSTFWYYRFRKCWSSAGAHSMFIRRMMSPSQEGLVHSNEKLERGCLKWRGDDVALQPLPKSLVCEHHAVRPHSRRLCFRKRLIQRLVHTDLIKDKDTAAQQWHW